MELFLNRTTRTVNTTIGELFINNVFECYTLEDQDRLLKQGVPFEVFDSYEDYQKEYTSVDENDAMYVKIKHKTAIPAGRYEIVMTWSNRFKKVMPLLLDVPGFTGIRIHSGNTEHNTSGCPLVGEGRKIDSIINSVKAFKKLESFLRDNCKKGKVFINIK